MLLTISKNYCFNSIKVFVTQVTLYIWHLTLHLNLLSVIVYNNINYIFVNKFRLKLDKFDILVEYHVAKTMAQLCQKHIILRAVEKFYKRWFKIIYIRNILIRPCLDCSYVVDVVLVFTCLVCAEGGKIVLYGYAVIYQTRT